MAGSLVRVLALLGGLAAAGCTQPSVSSQNDLVAQARFSARECGGPGEDRCNFFNGPVRLLTTPVRVATRSAQFFPTANRLEFVDSEASRWIAPRRTLTDGASIPSLFVPIIGAPRSPEFVNAAAVHDAHCGIGNETLPEFHSRSWEETHRMFYDALRAGGTEELRAKVMFAAVYLGGPRWQDDKRTLKGVPPQQMKRAMRHARNYILWTQPTPSRAQIEAWITRKEAQLIQEITREETNPFDHFTPNSDYYEEYGDGFGDGTSTPGEYGDDTDDYPDDGCIYSSDCDPSTGI